MRLVIDVPEDLYIRLSTDMVLGDMKAVSDAVLDGTPLPKGHGRLIDADALPLDDMDDVVYYWGEYIRNEPTIIEADKEY